MYKFCFTSEVWDNKKSGFSIQFFLLENTHKNILHKNITAYSRQDKMFQTFANETEDSFILEVFKETEITCF